MGFSWWDFGIEFECRNGEVDAEGRIRKAIEQRGLSFKRVWLRGISIFLIMVMVSVLFPLSFMSQDMREGLSFSLMLLLEEPLNFFP